MTQDQFGSIVIKKYPEHENHAVTYTDLYKNGMDSGRCSCGVLFLIGYDPTLNWGGGTGCNMIAARYPDHISRKPLLDLSLDRFISMADQGI